MIQERGEFRERSEGVSLPEIEREVCPEQGVGSRDTAAQVTPVVTRLAEAELCGQIDREPPAGQCEPSRRRENIVRPARMLCVDADPETGIPPEKTRRSRVIFVLGLKKFVGEEKWSTPGAALK